MWEWGEEDNRPKGREQRWKRWTDIPKDTENREIKPHDM